MTTFSHTLRLSGLLGLAVGFAALTYRFLLEDGVLYGGVQTPPEWLAPVILTLAAGSFAALHYAAWFDRLFATWLDVVTAGVVVAQWGLPLSIYLAEARGLGSLPGLLIVVGAFLHALVAAGYAVAYGRFAWREVRS